MRTLITSIALGTLLAGGSALAETPAREPATRADAQTHAGKLFDRLDANKDGKVDAGDRAARLTARFDRFDADHDGQISRAEFLEQGPAMKGRHGGRRGRHGAHLIKNADADRDGVVTRSEFSAAALRRFDAADTNRDGTVSAAERTRRREAARARRRAQQPPVR